MADKNNKDKIQLLFSPQPENKLLDINSLEFDNENYRYYALKDLSQEEIYGYFKNYSVGFETLSKKMSRKILKLDFIVIPSPNNNKYIVLDGNTRLSVLTDMKKQNHPFVKNGYELNCDIYTDKKEAKDILSETHTKESKTEWNLLNQARFNQDFGVFSDRDKTILQIFDHLQEIDEIFTFRNVEYTVRNCLETPLGDTFIKFYIKCYECDIVLPMSGLKEIDKKRLYELLMMFINNSKDSKSKQLIKNAIKRH